MRRAALLIGVLVAGAAGIVGARLIPGSASASAPTTVMTSVGSLPPTSSVGTVSPPPTTVTTVGGTLPPTTTIETSPLPPSTDVQPPPVPPMPPSLVFGRITKRSGCRVRGPLPDRRCTPGAAFSRITARQVCLPGYAASVGDVPAKLGRTVYLEYGIAHRSSRQYEVDHLVSLALGGNNSIANVWPEAATPRPGFNEKDRLERYLRRKVCTGAIDLRTAQRLLARDWLSVYRDVRP